MINVKKEILKILKLGQYYQQVTSFTRAALLLGRFLSGVLSQVLKIDLAMMIDVNI